MVKSTLSNPYGPDKSSEEALPLAISEGGANDSAVSASDTPPTKDEEFLKYVGEAEDISKEYQHRNVERELTRSYRAWRNEHYEGSKYLSGNYKGRTRLFVPKTRSSIRKNMAATAASLFSTQDAVQVEAAYDSDPVQRATADALKANINYRTSKSSKKSGFPWFQICMGAHLDSQLTGISVSKQYWEYEQVETGETETKQGINEETGEFYDIESPVMRVVKDRPMIDLIPIENIMVDPAAPWYDPVQGGSWFCARYPMHLDDVKAMLRNKGPKDAWRDNVTDEELMKGTVDEERTSSRRARDGGEDRFEEFRAAGGWTTVWINENFMRIDGIDYHFWSVGRYSLISDVRKVHEAYPALHGERPYVFGVSQIDSHRVFPMSPAESWQPLQQEINDVTNLRLDTLKRSIAPLAIVRRGRNVDLTQLQKRGRPDAVVTVDNMDDLAIEKTPGPSGASYTETSVANSNFDELAGSFSSSTVQQSRQINETVGGMKLMSGAANALTEFDLRVWSETYVEPAFRQIAQLILYYESDEKMMALCGEKARTRQKYGIEPSIDDLLEAEVTLTINAGLGALDPMQQMAKFKGAMEMLMPIYPIMAKEGVSPNIAEIVDEVMGNAGYKDGKRFFEFDGQPQKDPAAEAEQAKMQAEIRAAMKELELKSRDLDIREMKISADNRTKLQLQQMKDDTSDKEMKLDAAIEGERIEVNALVDRQNRQQDFSNQKRLNAQQGNIQQELAHITASQKASPASGSSTSSPQGSSAPKPTPVKLPPKRDFMAEIMGQKTPENSPTTQAGVNGGVEKILAQNQAQMASNNQMVAEVLKTLADAVQQLGKPKQVVRDAQGKVIGVE